MRNRFFNFFKKLVMISRKEKSTTHIVCVFLWLHIYIWSIQGLSIRSVSLIRWFILVLLLVRTLAEVYLKFIFTLHFLFLPEIIQWLQVITIELIFVNLMAFLYLIYVILFHFVCFGIPTRFIAQLRISSYVIV